MIMSRCYIQREKSYYCYHTRYDYYAEIRERFVRLQVGKYDDDARYTSDSGIGSMSEVSQREHYIYINHDLVLSSNT